MATKDDSYENKLALLETIIQDGIQKLLSEAKEKGYLEEPYGRAPFPTPVLTEEQFVANGGLDCDDDEPPFNFEYGFNPLKILADFIQWSHPDSVASRQEQKDNAAAELARRANHAHRQLEEAAHLQRLLRVLRSGIAWGPVSTPISAETVSVMCKPLKESVLVGEGDFKIAVPCQVVFDLSTSNNFTSIAASVEVAVQNRFSRVNPLSATTITEDDIDTPTVTGLDDILPVTVEFTNLQPGTKYYIRCCLEAIPTPQPIVEDSDLSTEVAVESSQKPKCDAFEGKSGSNFQKSSFWTLPTGEEAQIGHDGPGVAINPLTGHALDGHISSVDLLCFGDLSGSSAPNIDSDFYATSYPTLCCIVADLVGNEKVTDNSVVNINKTLGKHPAFDVDGPLREASVLLGWIDKSVSSMKILREEEEAHKKLRHDVKKYQKKYGDAKSSNSKRKSKSSSSSSSSSAKKDDKDKPPPPVPKRPALTNSLRCLVENFPVAYDPKPFGDEVVLKQEDVIRVHVKAPTHEDDEGQHDDEHEEMTFASKAAAKTAAGAAKAEEEVGFATVEQLDKLRPTRQLFRSVMMGADIEVFVLDVKAGRSVNSKNDFQQLGYLGKAQAQWLQHSLQHSTATWKIIICGQTFGLIHDMQGLFTKNMDQLLAEAEAEQQLKMEMAAAVAAQEEEHLRIIGEENSKISNDSRSPGRSSTPKGQSRAGSPSGRQRTKSSDSQSRPASSGILPSATTDVEPVSILRQPSSRENLVAPMGFDGTRIGSGADESKYIGENPEYNGPNTFEVDPSAADPSSFVKPVSSPSQGQRKVSVQMAPEVVEAEEEEKIEDASSSCSLHSVLLEVKKAHEQKLQRIAAAAAEAKKAVNESDDSSVVSGDSSTLLDGASSAASTSMSKVASAVSLDEEAQVDDAKQSALPHIAVVTEDGARIVRLSCGIVLLSGGTVVGAPLSEKALMPTFVSAYSDISPIGSDLAAAVFGRTITAGAQLSVNTAANESFCVEIGLGSNMPPEPSDPFVYNEGIDGITLFDSRVCVSGDSNACKLHLNSDGSLRINMGKAYACELRAPPPLVDVHEHAEKTDD